jgi:glycosyltransferase domain-containing protein
VGFLRRCLRHLAAQECESAVLVADGSSEVNADLNARAVHDASDDLDILHKVYPADLPFFNRCWEALCDVRTEAVTFQGDDDFLFVRAADHATRLLDQNPALVACQGQSVIVQHTASPHLARIHTYHTQSCESARPSERINEWLGNYRPMFYATTRTAALVHAFDEIARLEPQASRLLEIAICYFVLIQGGIGLVPGLFGVRESHPGATSQSGQTWGDIILEDRFSPWFTRFRARLVEFAVESGIRDDGELGLAINQSFVRYLALAFGKTRTAGAMDGHQRAFTLQLFTPTDVHDAYYRDLKRIFSMMVEGQ